jgi:hypothetical protein
MCMHTSMASGPSWCRARRGTRLTRDRADDTYLVCSSDKVTYVPQKLWSRLVRQFGGGPQVGRWVEFSDDIKLELGEHNAFKLRNADTGATVVLYVPGQMVYSRFRKVAADALQVTGDPPLVLCDECGENMDAAAEGKSDEATLYDVGYMVCTKPPAPPALLKRTYTFVRPWCYAEQRSDHVNTVPSL